MSKKITLDYVLVFHVHWRISSLQIKCVLVSALHCRTTLYSRRVLASSPFAFSKDLQNFCNVFVGTTITV